MSNSGSDQGKLVPMTEQLQERYEKVPEESLADGGFAGLKDIEKASELGTKVYAPVAKPKDKERDPHEPLATDTPAVAEWRKRMGTDEAKKIYKERAATVECVNALAHNRGLQRLLVRGMQKVRSIFPMVCPHAQYDSPPVIARRVAADPGSGVKPDSSPGQDRITPAPRASSSHHPAPSSPLTS